MHRLFDAMKWTSLIVILFVLATQQLIAQPISGVWRGKVSRGMKQYSLELKLIRYGDSLTGTSYYYSGSNFARFAVKGIMTLDGDAIWWDKDLLEEKGRHIMIPNQTPYMFAADFNCPGGDILKLDGTGERKEDPGNEKPAEVHLNKVEKPVFEDNWDVVIENYPQYVGNPRKIREVERQQYRPYKPSAPTVPARDVAKQQPPRAIPEEKLITPSVPEPTIIDMFNERKKVLVSEIPVTGDSILLRFYDNAEIDGDSISLFLNGKMMFQHVLLKAEPLEMWLNIKELGPENELTMVAENLGSIPPNTSLMITYCNGIRYEAKLESTEHSSAMIKFKKPNSN